LLSSILVIVFYTIIGQLLLIGVDINSPLTGFRRYYFCTFIGYPLRVLLFILGINIRVSGSPYMKQREGKEKPNILVSNHLSYLDIGVLACVCESIPGFVTKKQLLNVPLIGTVSRIWGCIYTDQLQHTGVSQIISQRANHSNINPLIVFPEGTTSNGKYLIFFHSGAFVAGKPVKPVIIRYPYLYFNPTWETILLSEHIFKLLTQIYINCDVHFLPTYYPTESEKLDPKLYARNIQREMSQYSELPIIESSYKDKLDYHQIVMAQMQKESKFPFNRRFYKSGHIV